MTRNKGLSRTPNPTALRDQILAVLRDADGFPISTGQIAAQVGGTRGWRGREHNCPDCTHFTEWHDRPLQAEHIRPHLQALAKQGKVECMKQGENRSRQALYWRALG